MRRETPPARGIVGHQHEEPAGETDEGGKRSALGTALLLLDLNQDFLSFGQKLADVQAPALGLLAEELLGDFLQRQESVALCAIFHEAGFKRRFDAGDAAFVDVGFLLFARSQLDTQVIKLLSINQGNSQLFLLSCIDEHSFHGALLCSDGPARKRREATGAMQRYPRGSEDSKSTMKVCLFT